MKDLKIGLGLGDAGGSELNKILGQIRDAEADGFQNVWLLNIFGMDALTLAALAGRETSSLEVATAVMPTYARHPLAMAQQALTTQAALGGRFILGLGPSHRVVIENMLGLSYAKPARHVREYVTIVKQLFETGKTSFQGETYQVNGSLAINCGPPPQVLIGALGPLMRKVAGDVADGTITWMTGPRTLADQVIPGIRDAAEKASRPAPRVVAMLPVLLTDDPDGAKQTASKIFAMYGTLPSYRAMLDAEGLKDPGEIAIVGDERTIEAALRSLADSGVTDYGASIFPHGPDANDAVARTRKLLSDLARS